MICDDQFFHQDHRMQEGVSPRDSTEAPPYEGAKPYFLIEDLDDRDFLTEFITATCRELPMPKAEKQKRNGTSTVQKRRSPK